MKMQQKHFSTQKTYFALCIKCVQVLAKISTCIIFVKIVLSQDLHRRETSWLA